MNSGERPERAMAADDLSRPPFRGCVFCYTAEMSVYGARKAARALRSD